MLFLIVTLLVAGTAACAIVLETAWFKNRLRNYIVREANQHLNGELSIGSMGGNLFYGVSLERVAVSMDGRQVVGLESIDVRYDVFEMLSHGVSIARITVNRPTVFLDRRDDAWTIARLVKPSGERTDRTGNGREIAIQRVEVTDGTVEIGGQASAGALRMPHRFDRIDASLGLKYQAAHYVVDVEHVSFRASEPAIGLNALSGSISVEDNRVSLRHVALRTEESSLTVDGSVDRNSTPPLINLTIDSDRLSLPEIAHVVPALHDIPLQPAFAVTLNGPTNRLSIGLTLRSAAGRVSGALVANFAQPDQSVTGNVALRDVNLAPIIRNPDGESDISGKAVVTVHGAPLSDVDSLRWSVTLDSPHLSAVGYVADDVDVRAQVTGPRINFDGRARAYGGSATATGFVILKGERRPLTYDLHGVAQHVDLRLLPPQTHAPPASSDISAAYQVSGSVAPGSGENRHAVTASGIFEASIFEGMHIDPGSTGGVTVAGPDVSYWGDATVAQLNLRRIGEVFDLTTLGTERFESSINGHVTASVRGTRVSELILMANGTVTDSSVLGGHVANLSFDTDLRDDALHVMARGAVDQVDLKAAFRQPSLEGQVQGSLDAQATFANISQGVARDRLEVTGRFDLRDSRVNKFAIDRATVDGDYRGSTAAIRTLDVAGPYMSAQAHGRVALDESSQSDLSFHADGVSLDEVGKLIDKPLAGMATVDGTVTGNPDRLTIAGHASGNDVKYGDRVDALMLTTDYAVQLPGLKMGDASISATTNASFVSVAGQSINELAGKTDYADGHLQFDATARQPNRSLSAAGEVSLQSDQREVRLHRLEAATQGVTWQLAPDAQPVVGYADGAVVLKGVRLKNGDQQIDANGAFGRPNDAIDVTLDNVDLAAVDTVLLRPPQFSGRLSASAKVSGTGEQPRVHAEFHVTQGGFRQFRYADLSGTTDYGGRGFTVDAKLQQDPSAWLTAKGYVPLALLKGPGNATTPHGATSAPEDTVNLKIESSAIDLGLIQGFTTALTKVKGTLQANLELTGPAGDPHPGGSIDVRDAAFTVGASGVAYSGGAGRVEFQGDRVHIDQLRLVDNQRKLLTVSGDLAFHERGLGGVDLLVKARDFKVIDNKIGNVRINSDLHVAGELGYPRIEGDLGVSAGTINLDELLASTLESPYSTTPINASTGQAGTSAPSLLDALQMEVHVRIQDDLTVKGSDLRVSDAPVGLGAVNVTLGGDLWVSKTPWDRARLTGSVNTIRGTYDFQGRRFDLLRDGTVRFDGVDEREPHLDIRAQRLIQGVQANVNLRGTLRHPDIDLTSVPPLPQSDILALIVFNQPTSQIGAGQQVSLVQRAQSMALGALAGQLASSIGSALDLNTFEVQVAPDTGVAAQITVGQQVSQNLFVKVDQGFGDYTSTNVVIEYQMGKWLLLQSNLRGGETTLQPFQHVQGSGMDLIFFFSY